MFVYVVREVVAYEGDLWTQIVKDDDFATEKIKNMLVESIREDIEVEHKHINYLEEEITVSPYVVKSNIRKRIDSSKENMDRLVKTILTIGLIKSFEEYGEYEKTYNTLSVEKVKVI